MKSLLLALLLSGSAHAIEVKGEPSSSTSEALTTPTITSGTQVGNWTGATIVKESGAKVDPDVLADTVGIGQIDDQGGAGNVGLGLWVQQAGAGDNFGISVDPNGGVYFIVGNRSGASTMSPFIQYDSVGSLAMGGRGSGGGGAAGSTPAFIYNESSGKVGIFESAPNGQVDIGALAARKPTDPLVQVSSQNATGVYTINVNGDTDQAGNATIRSSATVTGNLQVDGTANIIGLGGTPLALISTATWTPVSLSTANLDAVCTFSNQHATRVGNLVNVFGSMDCNPTTTLTSSHQAISLPTPGINFTSGSQLGGAGSMLEDTTGNVSIQASTTLDGAIFQWKPTGVGNTTITYQFGYIIP